MSTVRLDRDHQALRPDGRRRRLRPRGRRRRVRDAARAVGLRQDDDAADDRRPHRADRRPDLLFDDRGRHLPAAAEAEHRLRLPDARAVPAPVGRRQRRLRAVGQGRQEGRDRRDRVDEMLAMVGLIGYGARPAGPAVRAGSSSGSPSRASSPPIRGCCCSTSRSRRSTRTCATPQVLDPRPPAADRQDRHLRHPRPVRGVRDLGPDRRDEQRSESNRSAPRPTSTSSRRRRSWPSSSARTTASRRTRRKHRGDPARTPGDRPRRRPDAARARSRRLSVGDAVIAYLRPEDVRVLEDGEATDDGRWPNIVEGVVDRVIFEARRPSFGSTSAVARSAPTSAATGGSPSVRTPAGSSWGFDELTLDPGGTEVVTR